MKMADLQEARKQKKVIMFQFSTEEEDRGKPQDTVWSKQKVRTKM